jgi:hypothetical protein
MIDIEALLGDLDAAPVPAAAALETFEETRPRSRTVIRSKWRATAAECSRAAATISERSLARRCAS